MKSRKRFLRATLLALILIAFAVTSAFAHYCTNPNKHDGAGSIGTYNVVTETFEPNQPNGGFLTVTDGATFTVDIYAHQELPPGALAAGPGGDDQCDGLGVDSFLACIGVAEE